MQIDATLALILLQVLVVLAVATLVLGLVTWRLRVRQLRLMRAYVKLKALQKRQAAARRRSTGVDDAGDLAAGPNWQDLKEETLLHYQTLTGKTLGDYSREDPFSARIASVRYHYLSGELDAADNATTDHQKWQMLERSIAALLRLLADNAGGISQQEADQTPLLRQRLQSLKQVEQDNASLRAENQRYGQQVQKLRRYYERYKQLVAQLDSPLTGQESHEAQLKAISHTHRQRRQLMGDIHQHVYSDRHRAFYQSQQPLMSQLTTLKEGVEKDTASIDILNDLDTVLSVDARFAHIRTLQENNRTQRNLIIELRKELKILQRAMVEEAASGDPGELPKLERMVRELEYCIETLESEVDALHEKLQAVQQTVPEEAAAKDTGGDPVSDAMLGFALAIIGQKAPQDILSLIANTLVQLNMQFALRLQTDTQILYRNASPMKKEEVQTRMDAIRHAGSGVDAEGGLAINGEELQIYVPAGSVELVGQEPLQRLAAFIQNLVNLQLEHLHTVHNVEKHHHEVEVIADKVRQGVTRIDMQYAYQTEETHRIVQTLTTEIRQLVDVADMDQEVSDLFANVINEAEERFKILYRSGSGVDSEISALSSLLDKMK